MAGTTNTLVEIADYYAKGNAPGAKETLNALENKYRGVVAELFPDQRLRATASAIVAKSFELIRSMELHPFQPR